MEHRESNVLELELDDDFCEFKKQLLCLREKVEELGGLYKGTWESEYNFGTFEDNSKERRKLNGLEHYVSADGN